jgi:hypothetical protein
MTQQIRSSPADGDAFRSLKMEKADPKLKESA